MRPFIPLSSNLQALGSDCQVLLFVCLVKTEKVKRVVIQGCLKLSITFESNNLKRMISVEEYTSWIKSSLQLQLDARLEIFEQSTSTISESTTSQIERGIRATASIPSNCTLAIVPFASLLTIETEVDDSSLRSLKSGLREDDYLSLLILYEKNKRENSKWFHHFQYVPTIYHSIINYSEDELELLKGSNLYDIVYRWKDQTRQDFQELKMTFQTMEINEVLLFGQEITYDLYQWCLCTIWSRCMTIERQEGQSLRALVPFLDLLNHSNTSQVGHAFHFETNALYLYTGQNFEKGQEINLYYGACSNLRLLMLYGFTLSNNEHDTVDLFAREEISFLSSSSTSSSSATVPHQVIINDGNDYEARQLRREILLQNNLLPMAGNTATITSSSNNSSENDNSCWTWSFAINAREIPEKLLAYLRVQHSSFSQLQPYRTTPSTIFQPLLDMEDEIIVLRAALQSIQQLIDSYPTSLKDDLQRLQQIQSMGKTTDSFQHPQHRMLHILYFLIGEKKVLNVVLRRLNQLLQNCLQKLGQMSSSIVA
jgi:hypothetical protein